MQRHTPTRTRAGVASRQLGSTGSRRARASVGADGKRRPPRPRTSWCPIRRWPERSRAPHHDGSALPQQRVNHRHAAERGSPLGSARRGKSAPLNAGGSQSSGRAKPHWGPGGGGASMQTPLLARVPWIRCCQLGAASLSLISPIHDRASPPSSSALGKPARAANSGRDDWTPPSSVQTLSQPPTHTQSTTCCCRC